MAGNVISFPGNDPRPPGCDEALTLLKRARDILRDLDERGLIAEGGCPHTTLHYYLGDTIGMLEPSKPDVEA
jgi:hypothetical protein